MLDLTQLRSRLSTLDAGVYGLSEFLHANVEEAGREVKSSGRIAEFIEASGFTVTRGVAGLPTAFLAEYSPVDARTSVAFLCEYDGLPPYGQSCGHNVVSACSVGAASLLVPIADELKLKLVVAGTPAEEGFGGKYVMADAGLFRDVDAALLVYPGMTDIAASRTLRARSLEVHIRGKAAHAAAHPELGRNALDAFVLGYTSVAALRQHLPPQARVHGVIRHGGLHAQVVPDEVRATFVIRGPDAETVDSVEWRVRNCFVGAELQTGTQVQLISGERTSMALLPNSGLAEAYEGALKAVGRVPMPTDEVLGAWSTDAGYLSRFVPLLQPQLSMTGSDVAPHSHEFHAASVGEQADRAISEGSMALALTAARIAADSNLRSRIRDEFEAGLERERV